MDADFKQLSEAVMAHITAQDRGKETRRSYLRCFAGLGSYLNEKGVVYSQEEASAWLSSVRVAMTFAALAAMASRPSTAEMPARISPQA